VSVPETEAVRCEQRANVLVITIDRPETRNAVNGAVAHGLDAAMRRLDSDPELRVGVVTGAGGTFCSGMDLKAFANGSFTVEAGAASVAWIEHPPRAPLIAAVEGFAVAGGWELALGCDLVVASRTARFSMAEVRHGLVPLGGGALRLPRRIPHLLAMELLLTGAFIDAPRAAELGLVNRLTEPGRALEAALALAAEIAANGPLAVAAITAIARRALDLGEGPVGWQAQREIGAPVMRSADAVEGARAFAERRPARWLGR
jgi:enoyl-CoA hydratase